MRWGFHIICVIKKSLWLMLVGSGLEWDKEYCRGTKCSLLQMSRYKQVWWWWQWQRGAVGVFLEVKSRELTDGLLDMGAKGKETKNEAYLLCSAECTVLGHMKSWGRKTTAWENEFCFIHVNFEMLVILWSKDVKVVVGWIWNSVVRSKLKMRIQELVVLNSWWDE